MPDSRLNLFTRLYLIILVAVALSVTITKQVVDYYDAREELEFFQRDLSFLMAQLTPMLQQDTLDNVPLELPAPYSYHFYAYWFDSNQSKPCQYCSLFARDSGIDVYQQYDESWLAVVELPKHSKKLVIANLEDELHPQGELDYEGLDIDDIAYPLLLIVLAVFIALFIYWPVNKLQQQINQLVDANQSFGAGNLQARASTRLSRPLDALAGSFNHMATSISASVRESQIFSQAIPHEIRTPLSRIQMASGLLGKLLSEPKQVGLLRDINTNIKDINHLITQVVTYSRLQLQQEGKTLEQHRLHLLSFIHSRLELLSTNNKIDVQLHIPEEQQLLADPILIRLILDNLLKNAFTHTNRLIRISSHLSAELLEIKIEDDGAGIEPSQYEDIFIPFSRLDQSRNQQTGGLGLGLSIVKIASCRLGAQLQVSKAKSGGACFSLLLPVSYAH